MPDKATHKTRFWWWYYKDPDNDLDDHFVANIFMFLGLVWKSAANQMSGKLTHKTTEDTGGWCCWYKDCNNDFDDDLWLISKCFKV